MNEPTVVYLIRHGVAEARGERWPDDTKRPLTSKGKARLRQEAAGLRALDVALDEILTSPLVRTRQTAEILASAFARPPKITSVPSLAPGARPQDTLRDLARLASRRRFALVGHEPEIGQLAAKLIGARRRLDFKKGAVCCIEVNGSLGSKPGVLQWFLTPRMLRRLGGAG